MFYLLLLGSCCHLRQVYSKGFHTLIRFLFRRVFFFATSSRVWRVLPIFLLGLLIRIVALPPGSVIELQCILDLEKKATFLDLSVVTNVIVRVFSPHKRRKSEVYSAKRKY